MPPDITALVRPDVAMMEAYVPILPFDVLSAQLGRPAGQIVKMDANENPYGPSPRVREALATMAYPHIYPDPESRHLRAALSEFVGLPADCLLAGHGADELIDLIMRLFIQPGDVVINCPPTFGMYSFDAGVNAARVHTVWRREDFSLDVAVVEQAVAAEPRCKLVFVTSPNNPDGGLLSDADLARLLDLPVLVVLDEAYVEFAGLARSRIRRVAEHTNLVVLRTFSKWAGLAGLRLGYGAFPMALMQHLWKIKQPYNVGVAAQVAGIASLADRDYLFGNVHRIIEQRAYLMAQLTDVPYLRPYPSESNFILCRVVGRAARALKQALAERGILIRYYNSPGLTDHVRFSVGRPEDSEQLLAALREM
jgi:histidinol-phosphate aminotransferase